MNKKTLLLVSFSITVLVFSLIWAVILPTKMVTIEATAPQVNYEKCHIVDGIITANETCIIVMSRYL